MMPRTRPGTSFACTRLAIRSSKFSPLMRISSELTDAFASMRVFGWKRSVVVKVGECVLGEMVYDSSSSFSALDR
jgi:hypothetical protein